MKILTWDILITDIINFKPIIINWFWLSDALLENISSFINKTYHPCFFPDEENDSYVVYRISLTPPQVAGWIPIWAYSCRLRDQTEKICPHPKDRGGRVDSSRTGRKVLGMCHLWRQGSREALPKPERKTKHQLCKARGWWAVLRSPTMAFLPRRWANWWPGPKFKAPTKVSLWVGGFEWGRSGRVGKEGIEWWSFNSIPLIGKLVLSAPCLGV